jgi:hydroxyethylthiazole kinase-like uncharacterized protein yjeF
MKLFSTEDIRNWDRATILEEGILSSELMERAARTCYEFIKIHFQEKNFTLICGSGNNGGDGLAIARMLNDTTTSVQVFIVGNLSPDSTIQFNRLKNETNIVPAFIESSAQLPNVLSAGIVVDCLFGTGLSRPAEGLEAEVIHWMNEIGSTTISIDVPSGLNCSVESPQSGVIVKADYTLTFQIPKRPFLFRENAEYVGKIIVLDIGLSKTFEKNTPSLWFWNDLSAVRKLVKPIQTHQYKNSKGHLQLIAGSKGKMGAAVLAARGAKRSGCGLLTAYIPHSGIQILQTAVPEVMCVADEGEHFLKSASLDPTKNALAIGPGIGTEPETALLLRRILSEPQIPMVLDADALNLMADKTFLTKLPPSAIITPHTGEFDRLFGKHVDSYLRLQTQINKSKELQIVIVLKGAFTSITTPDGNVYFNSTGNPGMATAGSGDVLTGVIGSLLAQGYAPSDAAIIGVFLHGLSADICKTEKGMDGLMAGDFAENLPLAWKKLRGLRAID